MLDLLFLSWNRWEFTEVATGAVLVTLETA